MDGNNFILTYTGNDREQASLLRHLIDSGLPVKAFYEKEEGVQEQYLKTMDVLGKKNNDS